jgi:hypothetical protein
MIPSRKQSVTSVNSTGSTFRRPRPICIDKGFKAAKFNAHPISRSFPVSLSLSRNSRSPRRLGAWVEKGLGCSIFSSYAGDNAWREAHFNFKSQEFLTLT